VERYPGVEMYGSAGGGEVVVVVGAGSVVEVVGAVGAVDGVVVGGGAVVAGPVVVVGGCPEGGCGAAHPASPSASTTPTVHVRMSAPPRSPTRAGRVQVNDGAAKKGSPLTHIEAGGDVDVRAAPSPTATPRYEGLTGPR
jgi:hypothetical protein